MGERYQVPRAKGLRFNLGPVQVRIPAHQRKLILKIPTGGSPIHLTVTAGNEAGLNLTETADVHLTWEDGSRPRLPIAQIPFTAFKDLDARVREAMLEDWARVEPSLTPVSAQWLESRGFLLWVPIPSVVTSWLRDQAPKVRGSHRLDIERFGRATVWRRGLEDQMFAPRCLFDLQRAQQPGESLTVMALPPLGAEDAGIQQLFFLPDHNGLRHWFRRPLIAGEQSVWDIAFLRPFLEFFAVPVADTLDVLAAEGILEATERLRNARDSLRAIADGSTDIQTAIAAMREADLHDDGEEPGGEFVLLSYPEPKSSIEPDFR